MIISKEEPTLSKIRMLFYPYPGERIVSEATEIRVIIQSPK
jgi:hypothetical protein